MMASVAVMRTSVQGAALAAMFKSVVPPLTQQLHKGQAGRIGVVGGCEEYAGAPYFAAISALKVGADLSHVICTGGAAPIVKAYSPELIVHPILDRENAVSEISEWLPRLHALVIGPGLGRSQSRFDTLQAVINKAKDMQLPLVIDADGVVLVSQHPELIRGYSRAILTPNKAEGEFVDLFRSVMGRDPQRDSPVSDVQELRRTLGHVTIVRKGREDVITDGHNVTWIPQSLPRPVKIHRVHEWQIK